MGRRLPAAISRPLLSLCRDRRGVSALEFALIAPLMITMYIGTGVLCEAMMAQRRTSHIASAVGDLVGQQSALQPGYITSAFTAGQAIMTPFPTNTLTMSVTSITRQSNGKNTVDWSCPVGVFTVGSTITTVPAGLLVNTGDNILMSKSGYAYSSPATYFLPSTLNFAETFYLRPRSGSALTTPTSC